VRIGRHPNTTTRVVLDAAGMASYSVYALYNPYRLVIDCVRASAAATPPAPAPTRMAAAPVNPSTTVRREVALPPLRFRRVAVSWGRGLPSVKPRAAAALSAAHRAAGAAAAVALSASSDRSPASRERELEKQTPPRSTIAPLTPLPTPPAKNLAGGFSMARQLGLNVSRIVIDPGHGGHDPGAKGRGLTEAELVLDVALRLEALLQKIPGVEVILTRRTDEFIALPERTALANSASADLFLSIHANASPNAQARGIETYFLNFAKNQSAAAVAARENAESAQAMGALPEFIKAIALNNKMDESRDFATQVQRAMLDRLRGANKSLKDLGVKQAPFVVLIGAAMPSVLAEISFVTNPQEARLLKGPAYRQRIAEALLAAVRKYQTSLKGVSAVAHQ
jgi:N-acetylmuramoyl-L-alanine amidase